MKTVAAFIILTASLVSAQNMSISRGGTFTDGAELITQAPEQIVAGEELRMYELVSSLYTNKSKFNSSMRITVTHKDRIAQRPSIRVGRYDPTLIRELYKLRASFIGIMNQVAFDSADREIEGMPRSITSRYGSRRTNVVKASERDKEEIARRAEQSAILQLNRLTGALCRISSYGMTDRITHHYKLPDGAYILCITQRVKNPDSKAKMGSKTAVWWTKFVVEKDKPKQLYLDESNAISWDEIFEVD